VIKKLRIRRLQIPALRQMLQPGFVPHGQQLFLSRQVYQI